ncbi:MAG: M23 family metallopeptidase, partial [Defluviitaleaceae bacterium]|nr:M23 family metallopeptidase [Defluviitaleaceae bacterium]
SFRVGVNQSVSGGTHIANMGNTVAPGNAPVGVHLHFETRIIHRTPTIANANSTAIDPLANFFPNMRAAVSMHEYEEIIFDDISAMNANAAIARSSAELISYNYAETGEIFVSDTVFVLPNGNTTSLTLGNLSAFSSNEVISMGVSATNIQEIVDALGLEIVLEHLNGLGLGHLGLTLDGNGRVIYTR